MRPTCPKRLDGLDGLDTCFAVTHPYARAHAIYWRKNYLTHTSHTSHTRAAHPHPSRREGSLIVSFLRLCIYFYTLKV